MAFNFAPIELTPIDHMMPICYISFFYSFLLEDPPRAIPALQHAIHRLLAGFPFLAGNLSRSSQHGRASNVLEIQPPTADIFLNFPVLRVAYHENMCISKRTHQYADLVCYDSLFDAPYLPLPRSMARSQIAPIIRWQANMMQDGIVMAVSFHHSVFDAAGFYTIQQALAKICCNPNSSVDKLSLGSDLLEGKIQNSSACSKMGRLKPTSDANPIKMANFDNVEVLVSRRISLSADRIDKLRKACNQLMRVRVKSLKTGPIAILSSNDIISAFFWLIIMKARYGHITHRLKSQDPLPLETFLILMTDIRRTLTPPLPLTYIGNGVVQSVATSPLETAISSSGQTINGLQLNSSGIGEDNMNSLADLALQVHGALTSVNDAYVREFIEEKQTSLDWSPAFKQGDVTSTSLRRMGIYGLDFGPILGKVMEFDSPDNRIDGTVCIQPARFASKSAPWEIRVTLGPDTMAQLESSPLLQWAKGPQESKL